MSYSTNMVALSVMLTIAVISDLRTHRIPNWLSALGLLTGLSVQSMAGAPHTLLAGVMGAAVGLACFAPLYLLRAMGAGDVKLLAAAGSFLGPQGALYAALIAFIAGGVAAVGYVLWCALRASASTLLREGPAGASVSAFVAASAARRDRLAFALPIAVGSLIVCWRQSP